MMDFQTFKFSLGQAEPPAELSPPLEALWHQAKGKWENAHELVQGETTEAAAWVHAFLHRVEGDASNAGYWYRIAGRPHCNNSLSTEWQEIASHLLGASTEPALEMDH
jgi:hypothetical protein